MAVGATATMCAFHRDHNNQLSVDGISLDAIAKQYGTPVYVYTAAGITDTFNQFQNAVSPVNGKVHFAMKANSTLGILALIGKLGGGVDIVSSGELARAIAAGIKPSDIVFSGVGKTNDEIRQALACHIGKSMRSHQPKLPQLAQLLRNESSRTSGFAREC